MVLILEGGGGEHNVFILWKTTHFKIFHSQEFLSIGLTIADCHSHVSVLTTQFFSRNMTCVFASYLFFLYLMLQLHHFYDVLLELS